MTRHLFLFISQTFKKFAGLVLSFSLAGALSCESITVEEQAIREFREANSNFEQGAYKDCIKSYEFVIKYRPLIRDAYRNLAICYSKLGESTKAIDTYEKLLRYCNPRDTETCWDIARLQEKEGFKKDAIDTLNRLLEITPDDSRIRSEIERLKR